MARLHGIELVTGDTGIRPMKLAETSVIGIVGTAPDADAVKFPLNTPVLVAGNRTEAAALDTTGDGLGTLPGAMDAIFDQIGAAVVIIRVDEGVDEAATQSNVIGGVDAQENRSGIQALLDARSVVAMTPKILIAPGFSSASAVATELLAIAQRLRGFVYLDGPNTTDAAAKLYVDEFGGDSGKHGMLIDPYSLVWDTVSNSEIQRASSAIAAGVRVKTDYLKGPHYTLSNQVIDGIVGTARPIDFVMGDVNSRANLLNDGNVTTIIREDGYRFWGSRTLNTSDAKWAFEPSVRIDMLIKDTIQQNLLWAVDKPINKTLLEDTSESVNAMMRQLIAFGWILGGECWVSQDKNTATSMAAGQVYFQYDFTVPAPAELLSFEGLHVESYYSTLLAA